MPAALAAIVPLIIGAFSGGGGGGGSSTPAAPTTAQTDANALKTRNTQETAITQQFPSLQAQTGGSLSPEALLQLAQMLSGQTGQPGIGGSVQDLLQKMTGGSNVSAGNAGSGGSPSGPGLTPGGASGGAFG
jgi:hypothetical protein